MNHITLIGRLTKDPELRYTTNGAAVCTFTLAVDRPFTNKNGEKETDFINIQVWNKRAESSAKYLTKGKQAAVEGRLQIRSYEDKNGQRRWATEVVAGSVEFLGSGQGGQGSSGARPADNRQGDGFDHSMAGLGEEIVFDDMDVPF